MFTCAHDQALAEAAAWLATPEAADFARYFGSPQYAWDEAHDRLAYRAGQTIVPIHSEAGARLENYSTYLVHRPGVGDSPGKPLTYDDLDGGLGGAERTACASTIYPPQRRTPAQREMAVRVEAILAILKDRYREVLRARYYEGLSTEALAARYGVTRQAVQSRLRTAHRAFAEALAASSSEVAA